MYGILGTLFLETSDNKKKIIEKYNLDCHEECFFSPLRGFSFIIKNVYYIEDTVYYVCIKACNGREYLVYPNDVISFTFKGKKAKMYLRTI